MPRPRVKDEDRKRVARACDTCKRRKEKCDGNHPCLLCRRRSRESECVYSTFGRGARGGRRGSQPRANRVSSLSSEAGRQSVGSTVDSPEQLSRTYVGSPSVTARTASTASPFQLREALASSNDAEIAIESLLTLSGTGAAANLGSIAARPGSVTSGPESIARRASVRTPQDQREPSLAGSTSIGHAPVPKLARLLRDGHGKFIFVGDSSTLAFLQNIRRLAKTAIGDSVLTTDPKRHAMIEAIPDESALREKHPMVRPKPTRAQAEDLVKSYLVATSGLVDIFDNDDIMQHMLAWTNDTRSHNSSTSSIFYLVLAIGAQNRPGGPDDFAQAASYFRRGKDLAVSSFMDDPSVLTVQSYTLIAFYLLTTCRRNGAFMLLGIAIRAAYALGLHRSDISTLFEARERKTRERVWKSLRVLDVFLSASLGRPPATSEVDGGNVAWEGNCRGYEEIRLQDLHSSAMLRICFIFERILNEVYCRREISVQLVESISRQFRDWNLHLQAGLECDGLSDSENSFVPRLQQAVGLTHLKSAYYWSIILLTRPFLIFDVSSKLKDTGDNDGDAPIPNNDTQTLSEACIDAALRTVEIASDVVHMQGHPTRPVCLLNNVFVATLVVGLAMFGDYDKTFPLVSSIKQARLVLGLLSEFDPAGRRYAIITDYLQQATLEHIRRRDERQMKRRRQGIHSIFGDILRRNNSEGRATGNGSSNGMPQPENVTNFDQLNAALQPDMQDLLWPQRLEEEPSKRGPTLTTSGALASSARDGPGNGVDELANGADQNTANMFPPVQGDMANISPFTDEFPLFSLTTEFDSIPDTFLEFL